MAAFCACYVDIGKSDNEKQLGFYGHPTSWLLFEYAAFGSYCIGGLEIANSEERAAYWSETPVYLPKGSIPSWSRLHELPVMSSVDNPRAMRLDLARGWPFKSFYCGLDYIWEGDAPAGPPTISGGIRIGQPFASRTIVSDRLLPFRPIWSGVIIDVLFYTIVWVLIFALVRTLLRYRRQTKGQCPECGYQLYGAPNKPCPECGTITKSRRNVHERQEHKS